MAINSFYRKFRRSKKTPRKIYAASAGKGVKEMIEIKEEDIVMDSLHRGLLIQVTSKEECEQLKQQILETMNQYPEVKFALKHEQELFEKLFTESEKDRQIVKRLAEQIENNIETLRNYQPDSEPEIYTMSDVYDQIIKELQKILEGKK